MTIQEIKVPNIGDTSDVEVIEILVSPGDTIHKEDSIITLESDKASMEIPSPYSGVVQNIQVKIGDKVSEGSTILKIELLDEVSQAKKEPEKEVAQEDKATQIIVEPSAKPAPATMIAPQVEIKVADSVHASPVIRRLAREFGVDLTQIKGTGPKDRILKEDLQNYVKTRLTQAAKGMDFQVTQPQIDFSKFGSIEQVPLSKIKKLTGVNVHRSWVSIPHVTQFDHADITALESFRKTQQEHFGKQGIKLTLLVFIMKAVVATLKAFPHFNASLDAKAENLILKKYYNLGIAVDTPNGLVVPVVRDVDKKGMLELAKELGQISQKAREKGLSIADMSGSCFTISSLGGIGGRGFTPIINAPDVAILGVSKSMMTPVYEKGQFIPRLMLPLSLSYDHRVIDGADGARFLVSLANSLADIRTLLL